MVLSKLERQGTDQQRRFVEIALATPDFAILEGPPGSGKTTAICELVLQLAKAGKRVLLCASTHVAVDNVLERLMAAHNLHRDLVIPVRIGDERNPNIAEGVRDWQLQRFLRTERRRLLAMLEGRKPLSDAQLALRDELRQGETAIERLVLEAANLVCGTTIGILQHPDLKARSRDRAEAAFDVLILDEASKTTFQEFLVPAMWAKRWVIVGDPKQLSPFVDEDAMASNIEACLPDGAMRDACVDVFEAAKGGIIAVASDAESAHHAYFEQAQARGVTCANVGDEGAPFAQIVVGSRAALEANLDRLPLDVGIVRAPDGSLDVLRRRAAAWWHVGKLRPDEPRDWAQEVGWRLASSYELRWTKTQSQLGQRRTATERLGEEINSLLPAVEGDDRESVWQRVDQVRRVALPSLLESLQHGFERSSAQHGTALTDGIPADHLHRRHVLLAAQHRMHPEIAAFSSQHVYKGEALHTPVYLEAERQWSYGRYARRSVWQHCDGKTTPWNSNTEEVQMVRRELAKFDEWAATNPRPDGRPWEVAVLTFYRGQERELRQELRRWSGLHHARGRFLRGPKAQPYLAVDLCTVDRFQGHEADLVILSIAKSRATYFLESPNRWNVALTRARYQRVIVGNRHGFSRASGLLGELARDPSWEQSRPEGQV
jgi:hypothetical protein